MPAYIEKMRDHPLYMGVFNRRQGRNVKILEILRLGFFQASRKFLGNFGHFPLPRDPQFVRMKLPLQNELRGRF